MTQSYTTSYTQAFTRTIARYIASKVAADLHRIQSYYQQPSLQSIESYLEELTELLAGGHVHSVEYGFQRDNRRIVSLYYEVRADGTLTDSHAGGVYARADVSGATWFSFLTYSSDWWSLSEHERNRIMEALPFRRSVGASPQDGYGYWIDDRTYATDGIGTLRRTFRPY
jgi:hypothetical protein